MNTVQGDLTDVSLTSLIQLMCTQRKSGAFVIERPGERGLVYLAAGEVVDAAAGALRGEEAVFRLLSWDEAAFRFANELRSPGRSIWIHWNELLLEGMRKLDEGKYEDRTEDDFVALLSTLEQILVQLKSQDVKRDGERAFLLYGELVDRVGEFWNALPETAGERRPLASLLSRSAPGRPALRMVVVEDGRLPKDALAMLYDDLAQTTPGKSVLPDLTVALLDVLENFLTLVVGRFRNPESRDHWSETCRLFVGELRGTVDPIEF